MSGESLFQICYNKHIECIVFPQLHKKQNFEFTAIWKAFSTWKDNTNLVGSLLFVLYIFVQKENQGVGEFHI